MERFCQGDDAAFEVLFERHHAGVQAFLWRMVRDAPLAEDLLQATFLSVVRTRGRYERGAAVVPWLLSIAANAARDSLRRKRTREANAQSAATLELTRELQPPPGGDPRLRDRLEAAFALLPESQREAVLLHKVHGLSFEEIAQAAGISSTAARLRAHRGYELLRTLLKDLEGQA